jgi:hypothetical protein
VGLEGSCRVETKTVFFHLCEKRKLSENENFLREFLFRKNVRFRNSFCKVLVFVKVIAKIFRFRKCLREKLFTFFYLKSKNFPRMLNFQIRDNLVRLSLRKNVVLNLYMRNETLKKKLEFCSLYSKWKHVLLCHWW